MAQIVREGKELLGHLDLRKIANGKLADPFVVTIEWMKIQGKIGYQIAKKQAIATASSASSIGFGWSMFFFGFVQSSWLTTSVGLMIVITGTYFLAFWTPKVVDRLRRRLDETEAAKFYSRWGAGRESPTSSETSG